MKNQVKTIVKVERFFTDTNNCSLENMFRAYFDSAINSALDEELSIKMTPSEKEVA